LGNIPAQEQWFAELIVSSPDYEIDEPRLVVSDDEVTLVLIDREIADPDRPWKAAQSTCHLS
jgi:hypothetical protein